ncbi:fucose permease [Nesterenkonia sp. AN1]|uniref:Fucose permease n=1 Tax=Nesterenkonia aurantiaca TaxID=1436010 RepID=A0A4R7G0Y6_9MICC|nr:MULTISPECIES: MFS transporter [Nesterenkonia]EXF25001.1 fucose permease [Nesterenkonia sp. AN1]TDS84787.1 fucose permease [Nesterenkonia aurantiaca]
MHANPSPSTASVSGRRRRGAASLRGSRVATMAAFATNGALPASLLARYAEVKDALGLSPAIFGLVVVGFGLGGALALHMPGVLNRWLGVARTASFGTLWMGGGLTLAAAGVALGNPWVVVVGLLVTGFGDAAVDVAQNSQGLRVQAAYRRSLLNSMHAGWSIGAALGGAVGILAAVLGVPLVVHMAAWSLVCVLAMTLAARAFMPEPEAEPEDAQTPVRPSGWSTMKILLPLALIALAGISVEDVGNNWSAVLLSSERGMDPASAGVGLTVLLSAQFIGRMFGDRVIDRLGERGSLILSLSAVILGLLGAAWAPGAALTLVGLALAGLGCAVTVPLAFARADRVPGLPAHSGVTWISWAMRAVMLSLSPAIGVMTQGSSLPVAIRVIVGIAVVALALQLRPRRPEPADR